MAAGVRCSASLTYRAAFGGTLTARALGSAWGGVGRLLDKLHGGVFVGNAVASGEAHDRKAATTLALAGPVLADAIGPLTHRVLDEEPQLRLGEGPLGQILGDRGKQGLAVAVTVPQMPAALQGGRQGVFFGGPPR
jgi:hypothetical protein